MSRGGTRVYFGRLPRDVRERDVEKFIRGYGHYREISIKLGYGFVEFDDSKDADDCVYDLNGKELMGDRIVVEHARNPVRSVDYGYRSRDSRDSYGGGGGGGGGRRDNRDNRRDQPRRGRTPPVRTEHRLAVLNLSSRCNWQDLKEFMGKGGEVTFADAHKRRQGEGVVEFSSKEDMKGALKKLDDGEFFGRHIKLKVEKVKTRRSGSRSRSRSRSGSRPRHKSRSRSHSRSPKRRHRSSSDQQSRSKHSKSRSASPSKDKKSKSRSRSPDERSRSGSPKRDAENGEEELKEVEEVEEEADEEQPEQVEENGEDEKSENMEEEDAEKKDTEADEDGDGDDA